MATMRMVELQLLGNCAAVGWQVALAQTIRGVDFGAVFTNEGYPGPAMILRGGCRVENVKVLTENQYPAVLVESGAPELLGVCLGGLYNSRTAGFSWTTVEEPKARMKCCCNSSERGTRHCCQCWWLQ